MRSRPNGPGGLTAAGDYRDRVLTIAAVAMPTRPRVALVAWDVGAPGSPSGLLAEIVLAGRERFDFVVVSNTLLPELRPLVDWRRVPHARLPVPPSVGRLLSGRRPAGCASPGRCGARQGRRPAGAQPRGHCVGGLLPRRLPRGGPGGGLSGLPRGARAHDGSGALDLRRRAGDGAGRGEPRGRGHPPTPLPGTAGGGDSAAPGHRALRPGSAGSPGGSRGDRRRPGRGRGRCSPAATTTQRGCGSPSRGSRGRGGRTGRRSRCG